MLKFLSLTSAMSIALILFLSKVSFSQPLVLMEEEYPEIERYALLKCYIQTSDKRIFDLQKMCESSSNSSNYSGRVIGGYNFSTELNTTGSSSSSSSFSGGGGGPTGGGGGFSDGFSGGSGSGGGGGGSGGGGAGPCQTPDDIASDGSRCGGRAASERPGGLSGGSSSSLGGGSSSVIGGGGSSSVIGGGGSSSVIGGGGDGSCQTPDDIASDGSRCGGRAASERPGGLSGGSGSSSGDSSSGGSINPDDSALQPAQILAEDVIRAINQAQQTTYLTTNTFATTIEELRLGLESETENYVYSLTVSPTLSLVTATARTDGLDSYTGAVLLFPGIGEATMLTVICKTDVPSKTPPEGLQLNGIELECPAGSSKVN